MDTTAISACHINAIEAIRQESGPDRTLLQVDATLRASLDNEGIALWTALFLGSAALRIAIHARNGNKPPAAVPGSRVGLTDPPRATPGRPDAVPTLQSGEYVEVKTFDEIRETLDGKSRSYELVFTPELHKHAAVGFCAGEIWLASLTINWYLAKS